MSIMYGLQRTQIAPSFCSNVQVLAGCSGVPLWSMQAEMGKKLN